jgi:hypothetical protein
MTSATGTKIAWVRLRHGVVLIFRALIGWRYVVSRDALSIGGLSRPTKLPGWAFGLSPANCLTGNRLRSVPGSVCSECYASKNAYLWRSVTAANQRRDHLLQRALTSPDARQRYTAKFARLLSRLRHPYFRWHDSGDLQSPAHLALICDIASRTPGVRHWLPTREYKMVRDYLAGGGTIPENLSVRLSAHMCDQVLSPAAVPVGCTSSGVYADLTTAPGYRCPSRSGTPCPDHCRACWDRGVPLVTYPLN